MELNQQQREAIGKNLGSLLESYAQSQPIVEQAAPAEGFTWTGYLGDFGSSALSILSNLSGAGGTILDWVDGVEPDGTEKNLRTLGRDGFKYIESILEKASEGLADDRPKITQDQVLKGFEDGDFVPAMLFVRDSFPNAAAYLGAAFIGGGIPLLVSESERTLEERMSNLKKGTGEASAVDVGASMLSAIINVWAERIPVLKAGKGLADKGKMRVSLEALARDLGWEAGGGASEDILTKIGTDAELTAKGVSLAAFFEALGGLGVSPVSVGAQLSRRSAQKTANEQLESVKSNIVSDLEAEKAETTGRFKNIQLANKISKVKKYKTLASLLADYPQYDPTIIELGDDPSVLEDQAPEEDASQDPSVLEDTAPTQGRIEPTLPGPQGRPRQTITVPAEQVPDDIDPDNLPEGVSIDEDGKLTITITEGTAEESAVEEIARIDAEIESLMSQGKTGGIFSDLLSRPERDAKVRELQARKAELQKTLQTGEGQRDSEGRVVTPTLGGPADIDVPAFGVEGESTLEPEVPEVLPTTEAESTDGLDASLSEEERAIRIRQARERADRAQAAEAETPGKATEEDLKLTEEARNRADEGERSETPIIETELGPSTINTGDIELDNRVEENRDKRRAARESAQNIPQDRDEAARQAADPNRKEQLEREKAERDDLQRQAEADEKARAAAEEREVKRQERAAEEKAADDKLEAEEQADSFILQFYNQRGIVTPGEIKIRGAVIADQIKGELGPKARRDFVDRLNDNINILKEEWAREDAAEREAKAAGKPAPTTPTWVDVPPDAPKTNTGTWTDISPPTQADATPPAPDAAETAPDEAGETEAESTTPPPGTDTTADEGAPAAPKKKRSKKKAKKKAATREEPDLGTAEDAAAAVADADKKQERKPPTRRQQNRKPGWKTKEDESRSTGSLNGLPATITKVETTSVDKEGKEKVDSHYEASYDGEKVVNEKTKQPVEWAKIDNAQQWLENKFASKKVKEALAKARGKAAWTQDRDTRWSKMIDGSSAVVTKEGEKKYRVSYKNFDHPKKSFTSLEGAKKFLDDTYPKARTRVKAGDVDAPKRRPTRVFDNPDPLPKAPGFTAQIKNEVDENSKPIVQAYVNGEPFTKHTTDTAARAYLRTVTPDKIAEVYKKLAKREQLDESNAARKAKAAASAGKKDAAAQARVKRAAAKQAPKARQPKMLSPFNFAWSERVADKKTSAANKPNVEIKGNYELSKAEDSEGYDISVTYPGKDGEIVLFSVPNIDQAQIIADSIRSESPLFLEFLTEQAKNKKIDLIAVRDETAKEFGARNAALEKEISRLEGKDKTSGELATLNDLKKQRKALKQEAVRVAMPKSSTESLNEWIDLLEDRGVLEASGMDALDRVQEARQADAEDAQGMDAQEEAYEDLKKKVETNEELVETLEETEEESVDERNDLVGQIKEDYIVLRDLVEAEETDVVAEILNNTPAKGGMSLSDLRELAKAIASQEDSFQFKSHKTKKEFAAQILEWATEEAVAEDVPSIEDESDFIITDEDLGWSDIKESRSRNPAKGFDSPIQASNALISQMNNIWGKKATRRMMETGFIKILTLAEVKNLSNKYKGISKETNAFVDETDAKIIFISDNIANNTNDARGLIFHEIGVHYGKRIFSGREFDQILDQLYKLNRDGDEVVQEAVNQVILNYTKEGELPPSMGPPAVKKSDGKYIRHQENSVIWEEVLAHVIQFKAADIKPTLWDRITNAFVNFFKKITKPFDSKAEPEVDVNDITSLIQYAVGKVPSEALRDPDNDKLRQRYSSKKKYEFLKDSLVKDKVWHASPYAWTAPVLEKTEIGMQVGTLEAAAVAAVKSGAPEPVPYAGYIKIKNPLELPDIGKWNIPVAWKNSIEQQDLLFHDGLDGPLGERISNIISDWTETDKVLKIYGKDQEAGRIAFASEIRKAILDAGYDSIKYTNMYEDVFSTGYILLKDGQFKNATSLGFREGQPAISESRGRRITKEVVENTQWAEKGRSSLLSGFKMIQKYIEPKMTLEGYRLLEKQSMLMKGKKEEAHNFGRIMHDILANVKGKKERDALTKFFETRDASPDSLPNRKIEYAPFESVLRGTKPGPKNQSTMTIREAAIKAKDQIERLGQDAVDVGVLKEEQYEELKGQYLPRVYLKYVQSGQDRLGTGYMPGSMGYTRARRSEESFIEDLVSGRIKDPAYLASRYISMVGSDLATIHYLNYIASDPANAGWVLPNQVVEIDGVSGTTVYFKNLSGEIRQRASILKDEGQIEDAKKQEAFANKIDKVIAKYPEIKNADTRKYKRIPKSVRYGGMQGLWVDKIIWDDITQQGAISSQNEVLNSILGAFTKVQKAFKYTHVPMQVPAQARNAISNVFFLNTSGVPVWRISRVINNAMDNIVNNGKYMQIARKYGIEQTTFASEELGRIDKEFAKATKDVAGMKTWSKLKIFMDNANVFGRLYQKTEVLFKIAKIIDLMENEGYNEADAAMEANEALLDYSNVSPLLRTLRSMPLGSPFITFNAKALTQMIRNIKKNPIVVAKYLAVPYVMAEILMAQFDELDEEDVEALKAFLPEYAENNGNVFFLPYKDDNGKWVAFDMSYFLPWGAHVSVAKDLANLEVGEAVKTIGVLGGPVQGLLGGLQNVDPFTGQPVWNENDTPHQQAQDIMMFMASYMIPPMLMPRNRAGDIATGGGPLWKTMYAYDVIEGNIGKDGLTKYGELDAWLSWFGINTIKIGDYEMGNKAYWTQKELTDIMKRAEKVMSDPNLTEEKRQELYDEYNKFATQKYLEIMEWSEKAQALQ